MINGPIAQIINQSSTKSLSHQLKSGDQTVRLVSETPLAQSTAFIKCCPVIDSLQVKSLKQNKIPTEYSAEINNSQNTKYKFKIGQRFAIISFLNLLIFSLIFNVSSGQIVIAKKVKFSPQISTVAYDCQSPNTIRLIDKSSRCQTPDEHHVPGKPVIYDLLAHSEADELKGHYCSIVKSSIKKQCGLLSIEKTLEIPNTEIPVPLTNLECLNLAQTLQYKTKDEQVFPLKMNSETILKFSMAGQVHSSTSEGSYCVGNRIKTDTGWVSSGFELIQLKIILKQVIIISENAHRLIVKEDNVYLPNHCQAHNLLCRAIHGIYIWQHNIVTNCNFEFFREATLSEIQPNIFVDHHNKILLSVPPNPQKITCLDPLRVIIKSSENVWLTKRPKTKDIKYNINNKNINGNYYVHSLYNPLRHVSLHSVFQTTFNYIMWEIESQLGNNHRDIKKSHCSLSNQIRGELIHITKNTFYKNLGDALSVVECKTRKVNIMHNSTMCYSDIILTNGLFLDPRNHLIKTASSKRDCSPTLPQNVIKTIGEQYYSQEPHLLQVNVLTNQTYFSDFEYTFNDTEIQLLQENEGLLTDKEWDDFNNFLQYRTLKQALGETLNMNLCLGDHNCIGKIIGTSPSLEYNIENLKFPEPKIDLFPAYTRFKSNIKIYAAEICIGTIIFQGFLFLFTFFDFLFSNNPSNQFRVCVKGIVWLFQCIFRCLVPYKRNPPTPGNVVNIELSRQIEQLIE